MNDETRRGCVLFVLSIHPSDEVVTIIWANGPNGAVKYLPSER